MLIVTSMNLKINQFELESFWDSSSVVLITYPDAIYRKDESTLKTLSEFVKN